MAYGPIITDTGASDPEPLPALSATPKTYPGCCLALSTTLLSHLRTILPEPPSLTLSIGSGYGLLEALLLSDRKVVGVEVRPTSNQYIPTPHHRVVYGSHTLDPLAAKATTWMFVYPKRVGLVEEYIKEFGDQDVEKIVWVGPKADWEDYKPCFAEGEGTQWDMQVKSADEVGGRAWEMVAVATKVHT